MPFLKSLSARLGQFLALYGGWGLFAISFLDSTFVTFPLVNDLLLIHLSSRRPDRMLVYALQATAGSILGAYVMYALGTGGGRLIRRKFSPEKVSRAQRWLKRNDFVSVLVVSLLPPPTPFKLFLLAAGMLRVDPVRFGLALLVGRGLRFVTEGFLGAHYGARAEAYLRGNLGWVSLAAVALVLGMTLVYRRFKTPRGVEPVRDTPRSSPSDVR